MEFNIFLLIKEFIFAHKVITLKKSIDQIKMLFKKSKCVKCVEILYFQMMVMGYIIANYVNATYMEGVLVGLVIKEIKQKIKQEIKHVKVYYVISKSAIILFSG